MGWLGGVELLDPGGVDDLLAGLMAVELQMVERAGYRSHGAPRAAAGSAGTAEPGGLIHWLVGEHWW